MLKSLVIISLRQSSVLTLSIRQANLHWPNAGDIIVWVHGGGQEDGKEERKWGLPE